MLQLASDAAASWGYAAILGSSWFYGAWPGSWRCHFVGVLADRGCTDGLGGETKQFTDSVSD